MKWLKWENGEEWGEIECPMFNNEMIMTYYFKGVPCYYTYSAPFVDDDGEVCYYMYDQDEGCWDEDLFFMCKYDEGMVIKFG